LAIAVVSTAFPLVEYVAEGKTGEGKDDCGLHVDFLINWIFLPDEMADGSGFAE
jgi:hypothetical protein